jgi:hypothetical protein
MAGAWVQRDQFQRALEEQELAVKYDPRSAIYRKNLGNILLGENTAAAAHEFREAIVLGLDTAELSQDPSLAYRAMPTPRKPPKKKRARNPASNLRSAEPVDLGDLLLVQTKLQRSKYPARLLGRAHAHDCPCYCRMPQHPRNRRLAR